MALYSTVSPVVMQRTSSSSSASDLTLAGKSHFTPPLPHPLKVGQGHLSTQTHTLPSTQKHHNNAKILGRRRFRRNPNFLRPLTTLWWVVHTFGRNSAGKLFLITEMSSESKKKKKTTNAWHRWATSASYQNFRHFPKSPLATEATPRLVLARVPQNPGSKCQRVDRQDYKIQSAAPLSPLFSSQGRLSFGGHSWESYFDESYSTYWHGEIDLPSGAMIFVVTVEHFENYFHLNKLFHQSPLKALFLITRLKINEFWVLNKENALVSFPPKWSRVEFCLPQK